jgi:large subunit ribosomal protein L30
MIKTLEKQKRTIKALGLGRPNNSNVLPDNPQIRGMLNVVGHLIKVEEISE